MLGKTILFSMSPKPTLLLALFVAWMTALPVVLAAENASTKARALNNEGVAAFREGKLSLAIEKFESSVEKDAGYAIARKNLALALNDYAIQSQAYPASCIKKLEKGLFYSPENADIRFNLNRMIRLTGRDPNSFSVRKQLGDEARSLVDIDRAAVEYKEALEIKPDKETSEKLAELIEDKRRWEKEGFAALSVARRLQERGEADKAIEKYKEALVKRPKDPEVHFSFGTALLASKQIDAGIAEFRTASSLDPSNEHYKRTIETAMDMKVEPLHVGCPRKSKDSDSDLDWKVALWKQALKHSPNSLDTQASLAEAYYKRGDYKEANDIFEKLKRADLIGEFNSDYFLATIDEGVGDGAKALEYYQQYLVKHPKGLHADIARERSTALTKNIENTMAVQAIKKKEEALRLANRSKARQASDAAILARKHYRLMEWEKAKAAYRQAIQLKPKSATYIGDFADMLLNIGEVDNAIELYEKALLLEPNYAFRKTELERARALKEKPLRKLGAQISLD